MNDQVKTEYDSSENMTRADTETKTNTLADRLPLNGGLGYDLVETLPLGRFRMWTPSREFVPEELQQIYWGKTRDGLTGEFWVSGTIMCDSGIFTPNVKLTAEHEAQTLMAKDFCKEIGCSGTSPDMCRNHPLKCSIVKKVMGG